jgi:hypothetical protein
MIVRTFLELILQTLLSPTERLKEGLLYLQRGILSDDLVRK